MTLWGLGNIILIVVVVPVLVALLSRVLGASSAFVAPPTTHSQEVWR